VQGNFLVLCANKVVDNMGGGGVAPRIAEPFPAYETLDDRGGVVNATIPVLKKLTRQQRGPQNADRRMLTRRHGPVNPLPCP
jgi:hypothetical protein